MSISNETIELIKNLFQEANARKTNDDKISIEWPPIKLGSMTNYALAKEGDDAFEELLKKHYLAATACSGRNLLPDNSLKNIDDVDKKSFPSTFSYRPENLTKILAALDELKIDSPTSDI